MPRTASIPNSFIILRCERSQPLCWKSESVFQIFGLQQLNFQKTRLKAEILSISCFLRAKPIVHLLSSSWSPEPITLKSELSSDSLFSPKSRVKLQSTSRSTTSAPCTKNKDRPIHNCKAQPVANANIKIFQLYVQCIFANIYVYVGFNRSAQKFWKLHMFDVSAFLVGCSGLYCAVLDCTGLYWAVLGCTGLYWAVLGCTGLYCGVLGCIGQSH